MISRNGCEWTKKRLPFAVHGFAPSASRPAWLGIHAQQKRKAARYAVESGRALRARRSAGRFAVGFSYSRWWKPLLRPPAASHGLAGVEVGAGGGQRVGGGFMPSIAVHGLCPRCAQRIVPGQRRPEPL